MSAKKIIEDINNVKAQEKFIDATAKFLRAVGWNPLVAGNIRIEQQPTASKYHYQLVINFTGSKMKTLKEIKKEILKKGE